MRNYYVRLFTAGSAGCAAPQAVQHFAGRAALHLAAPEGGETQGSILQAVQHYKGYESLFTRESPQSISDQRSLR
jgi:hypothetical protein